MFFVLLLIIGLAAFLIQVNYLSRDSKLNLIPIEGKQFGGDFSLSSDGQTVNLQDFRGKVVAMYFGYTSCPDVCPTTLGLLGAAVKALKPEEAAQVQGLFISVDPERDQGEKLTSYARHFYPDFVGATGTEDQVRQVTRQYGVFFEKQSSNSALGYLVDHSSQIYIIDKQGQFKTVLPHDMSRDDILNALRANL
ncbi:MAG: SCO family protein [Thiothrix sp.]|nr:SCO family protein [Thiothrix sp.]